MSASYNYLRPSSLATALDVLADGGATIVAGGTDHYPTAGDRPFGGHVLDVTAVEEIRGIGRAGGEWRLGATTTWTEIREAELPPAFAGLRHAAAQVGGAQIQNRASIGGNLCNASPAADGVPPLLTLDAEVELASASGTRRLPLSAFIVGNRATARRPDELLTAVVIPDLAEDRVGGFEKLGSRRYLVISIVMAAAVVATDDAGAVSHARLAVGACSSVAKRLPEVEAGLIGRSIDEPLPSDLADRINDPLSPIDDIRGSADYRRRVAPITVARAIGQCHGRNGR